MSNNNHTEKIRIQAKKLDDAFENKNLEVILSCFADRGEIELLGVRLEGRDGVRKGIDWMYDKIDYIKLEPINILINSNTFFEEFLLKAKMRDGAEVKIKAAEVLIFEDFKIVSLRLYFDRLQLADLFATSIFERQIFQKIDRMTLKGLI